MSKLGEQRNQESAGTGKSGPRWVWILLAVGLLLVAWAVYDYFSHRRASTLDDFAKCLSSKGVRMYGAWWCPHCSEQKELFGFAFQYVNYRECGIESQPHSISDQCKNDGIQHFPTWQFPDAHRDEGVQPLTALAQKTGCKLP